MRLYERQGARFWAQGWLWCDDSGNYAAKTTKGRPRKVLYTRGRTKRKETSQWTKMVTLLEERNNEAAAKGAREVESQELQSFQSNRSLAATTRRRVDGLFRRSFWSRNGIEKGVARPRNLSSTMAIKSVICWEYSFTFNQFLSTTWNRIVARRIRLATRRSRSCFGVVIDKGSKFIGRSISLLLTGMMSREPDTPLCLDRIDP